MHRPPRPLRFALRIQRIRNRQRIRIQLDHRIQRRPVLINRLDPLEILLHNRPRRKFPGLHPILQFSHSYLVQLKRLHLLRASPSQLGSQQPRNRKRCRPKRHPSHAVLKKFPPAQLIRFAHFINSAHNNLLNCRFRLSHHPAPPSQTPHPDRTQLQFRNAGVPPALLPLARHSARYDYAPLRLPNPAIVSHQPPPFPNRPRISDTKPAMPRQSLLEYFQPDSRPPREIAVAWRRGYRTIRWTYAELLQTAHQFAERPHRSRRHHKRRPRPNLGRKFRRMARRIPGLPVRRRSRRPDGRHRRPEIRSPRRAPSQCARSRNQP